MTYTIKEVAELFDLSIYTLRYYDKQGLLPFVSKNQSGYREFTETDLNLIHTICCLKDTGMSLKNIRTYINYCMAGADTIAARKQLLAQHRAEVVQQIDTLQDNLKEIDFKITKYSAPDAAKVIAIEQKYCSLEKDKYALPNPYAK